MACTPLTKDRHSTQHAVRTFVAICENISEIKSISPTNRQEVIELTVQAMAIRASVPRRYWRLLRS